MTTFIAVTLEVESTMLNRIIALNLLLAVSGFAVTAIAKQPQPEIMGIRLGMSQHKAHARLKKKGKLEREERKRQEVWTVTDRRISHLLVGFDQDFRVRYVTALARASAPRISYSEVADVKLAKQTNNQGNYRFTWEVVARPKRPAFLVMAHGHDPQYLDSYSVKKLDNEEID